MPPWGSPPAHPGFPTPYALAAPRGPAPGLVYANPGFRVLGALIDLGSFIGLFFLWSVALTPFEQGGAGVGPGVALVLFVLLVLACLAMAIVIPGHYGGSVGMLATGMRVVREHDGSRMGYALAAGRFGVDLVIAITFFGVVANLVCILADSRNQAIHDKVCSTLVVRQLYPGLR